MISNRNNKLVTIRTPQAIVNTGSWTCSIIDTKGFKYMRVIVVLGATDIAMTAMKLQESNDSGMSGAADITGTVGGTDFTLPSATDDDHIFIFNINLKGNRKRYIRPVFTTGTGSTGTFLAAVAELSRAESTPATATDRGATTEVSV